MKATQSELSFKISSCKGCLSKNLESWFSLGKQPPANALLKNLKQKEYFFPLEVCVCKDCGLVQLKHVVDPKLLFGDYVYFSSTAPSFVKHFEDFAQKVFRKAKLKKGDLVVDIGSNDGILLLPFKKLGAKVVGIEPASKIAKVAISKGIPTVNSFFSVKVAKKVVRTFPKKAKVVTATNVFAHIYDLEEVVRGVKELLTDDGLFIVENPYLWEMVEQGTFDLVYHEHLFYYDITGLSSILNRMGMKVVDFEKVPVHGGSFRYYISKDLKKKPAKRILDALKKERQWRKTRKMSNFSKKLEVNKSRLLKLFKNLKHQKKVAVGYGAPAKASTILNFFQIDKGDLKFIVDDSPAKQNKYLPGVHIPILATDKLFQENPDYVLILAWNFAEPITQKLREQNYKGTIITPF